MTSSPQLPDPPGASELRALGILAGEIREIGTAEVWWRVHKTEGDHVLAWNALRTFGPLMRFDPHRLPRSEDPGRGAWYGASTPGAALAEAFQVDRVIDRARCQPYLTGLSFTRQLSVLDLAADSAGAWTTRVGGTYAISTGPHIVTQSWARAIVEAFPDLDGLRYNSRFAGSPCIALFAPASAAMPERPKLSLPLTHPALAARIAGAAKRVGYSVV